MCTTISYWTDLFIHGVTTSAAGDMWLTMFSYAGAPNRTLPLNLIGVYRKPDGTYLNGVINNNIVPTSWRLMLFQAWRCDGATCFSVGEYSRPSMNVYTGASVPFVQQSARQTDLMQSFIQDPAAGVPPVVGLEIGPVEPFGLDNTFKGTLPPEEKQRNDILTVYFALDRPAP